MGLPPLEYIDCFLDSPTFRDIIGLYEKELESNAHYVKQLVKECRHMIQATEGIVTLPSQKSSYYGELCVLFISQQLTTLFLS